MNVPAAREPAVGLAYLRRFGRAGLRRAIGATLVLPPFCKAAEEAPDAAAHQPLRVMPTRVRPLTQSLLRSAGNL